MKVSGNMELNEFEKKILKTIKENNLIEKNDKIILGVSGGPDSISMLNALYKICKMCFFPKALTSECQEQEMLKTVLVVAHVNHMIREEAKEEEEFVKNFCNEKKIQFYSKSIDVIKIANTKKIGMEEAGRIARYDFFDEVSEKIGANKIAIAHNKNDKVETMIMNVFRGSGLSGLKGIEVRRGKYIRPLIDCERQEIEKYCEEERLNPRIDKTNFENIYTRNKIRNIVIPYVKDNFNPNFIEAMSRLSCLIREEEDYIAKVVKERYQQILINETCYLGQAEMTTCQMNPSQMTTQIVLDLKKFNSEDKVIKSRIVLYTIRRLFGTSKGIEMIHVDDIIKLCKNNIGNKYLTPNKNIKVLVKNHKIYFIKQD